MEGYQMNSKTFCKTVISAFLILFGFSFWGCTTLPKAIYVPLKGEAERIPVSRKFPVQAALLISEEDRNYTYKVIPSILHLNLENVLHVFPLGEALEKDSIQIFSQIFRSVQVVRTPAEAQKFKIVIAPKIEEFRFRYEEGKGGYQPIQFILFTAAIKGKITLYSEGTRIWEKSVTSPEQQKTSAFLQGQTNEKDMGEVASQALDYVLKKLAEEIAQDPEVEKNAASAAIDGPKKTYARR
jgi:hypothetical protein